MIKYWIQNFYGKMKKSWNTDDVLVIVTLLDVKSTLEMHIKMV